jgi:hypothetical protein
MTDEKWLKRQKSNSVMCLNLLPFLPRCKEMVQLKLRGTTFYNRLVVKGCSVFEALLRKFAITAYGNQSAVQSCILYSAFSSLTIIIRSPAGRNELRPST